ncbi:putative quinol monooxygenase [Acuticoccus sp. MNP-M23]|uniref:putative quinol monooxygenase n=1 Tax=Acuticoccus sp. MNP-M23 TaxID=3072793 RepID=UPI0028158BBD|nr:putative quinol monooxygenase [Acuticoccus sp. MNP-M23]WMS43778.1 putative quinol monooxygenase [Acuticoccus sp. MNP-M23]
MTIGCTIIGTVVAKPEMQAELKAILGALVAPTRAETGCINYDFHVDAADPCVFVFYENWTNRQALDEHLAKPHLKPLLDRQAELLARPVEIRHLVMLSEIPGRPAA